MRDGGISWSKAQRTDRQVLCCQFKLNGAKVSTEKEIENCTRADQAFKSSDMEGAAVNPHRCWKRKPLHQNLLICWARRGTPGREESESSSATLSGWAPSLPYFPSCHTPTPLPTPPPIPSAAHLQAWLPILNCSSFTVALDCVFSGIEIRTSA